MWGLREAILSTWFNLIKVCFQPSERDKDVENTNHDAPSTPSKEVTDDGGSDGWVAGLPDANKATQ